MIAETYVFLERLMVEKHRELKSHIATQEVADAIEDMRNSIARILGYIELDKGIKK